MRERSRARSWRRPWDTDRELSSSVDLSASARSFLLASSRRDRWLRRRSLTILSALLVLALIGGIIAVLQAGSAADQRDEAVYTKLVAESDQLRDVDATLSAQLALTAYRMRPDPGLRARLLTAGNGPLSRVLRGHTGTVNTVAVRGDGRLAVSGGADDGTVRLWDLDAPDPREVTPAVAVHADGVSAVALSPDGRVLAAGSTDGTRLWDVHDPAHPVSLGPLLAGTTVNDLAISPDERLLAVADGSGAQLWRLDAPAVPVGPRLEAPDNGANALAFTPDGATLAVPDGTLVRSWDVADPGRPAPRPLLETGHTQRINALAVAGNGRTLATGSEDRSVRLFDLANPNRVVPVGLPLQGNTDVVNDVAFSPDSRTLATAGGDRTVRLWTVADPTMPVTRGEPLTGHGLAVMGMAFRPDGRGGDNGLVSVGKDAAVRLWTLPTTMLTGRTDYTDQYADNVVFRPDGRVAAIGNADNTVRLWDTTDPLHPRTLGELPRLHSDYVNALAFSPDGRVLATGSRDRTVRLWDLADPARPQSLSGPLPGQDKRVFSLAMSPDGRTVVAGSAGGIVRTWDVTDPRTPIPRAVWGAHQGSINSLAFGPTPGLLATASGDYTARLWDLDTLAWPEPGQRGLRRSRAPPA